PDNLPPARGVVFLVRKVPALGGRGSISAWWRGGRRLRRSRLCMKRDAGRGQQPHRRQQQQGPSDRPGHLAGSAVSSCRATRLEVLRTDRATVVTLMV